jgi:predicted  nucleic acid-binding Zn-ribbon protein
MATNTNNELIEQIATLKGRVDQLQTSSSTLRDDVIILQGNYTTLVNELTERLKAISDTFQNRSSG